MAARMKRRARLVLDMTPMVDIAFLLVIFFMSTYHARPPATVEVQLPDSRSPFKVPEANVMVINVLNPDHAKKLADSIGPTQLLALITNIREASAQPNLTRDLMRGMTNTYLPLASDELLKEIIDAPGKPFTRARACELAAMECARKDNFLTRMAKQEVPALTPAQYVARIDSMVMWYSTGREASQPLPLDQVGNTVVDERTRNTRLMMVMLVDKKCQSGKMLDLTSILQKKDVGMLRFSLVTNLKASTKPGELPTEGR
jgi:biopolymer transport protein ExbD